jgi:AcrR family transcriptional regulator
VSGRAGETRDRLLRAGREAFSLKPLAAVKLKKDILEPAAVSVGSFYHQFKDKGDLLVAILEEHSETMRDQFTDLHRPGPERSPDTIARESYALVFDMVDQHTAIILIQQHADLDDDPRIRQFNERDRLRWHRSRAADYQRIVDRYGVDLDVEFAAELVGMLTNGAIRRYLKVPESDRPAARERLIEGLVQLTLRGLPGLTKRPKT